MRVGFYGAIPKRLATKLSLADGVTLGQPSDASLVDHVHRFDSLQSPPCTLKRTVSFCQPDTLLHGPVILLDDVVQVFALPQANTARQGTFGLERFHGRWICRILVHVDDSR